MSRTVRRKKGYRWWMDIENHTQLGELIWVGRHWGRIYHNTTWDEQYESRRKATIRNQQDGGFSAPWSKDLKRCSSRALRASNRREINKMIQTQEFDTFDTYMDHLVKGLIWSFD